MPKRLSAADTGVGEELPGERGILIITERHDVLWLLCRRRGRDGCSRCVGSLDGRRAASVLSMKRSERGRLRGPFFTAIDMIEWRRVIYNKCIQWEDERK